MLLNVIIFTRAGDVTKSYYLDARGPMLYNLPAVQKHGPAMFSENRRPRWFSVFLYQHLQGVVLSYIIQQNGSGAKLPGCGRLAPAEIRTTRSRLPFSFWERVVRLPVIWPPCCRPGGGLRLSRSERAISLPQAKRLVGACAASQGIHGNK